MDGNRSMQSLDLDTITDIRSPVCCPQTLRGPPARNPPQLARVLGCHQDDQGQDFRTRGEQDVARG
jgi:hypothetical protein